MSFFKKLFGGGSSDPASIAFDAAEHEGYLIRPAPIKDGGQYRVCATISKEINGEVKEHRLIRADLLPTAEDAAATALRKAQQMIKEQGDRIFS